MSAFGRRRFRHTFYTFSPSNRRPVVIHEPAFATLSTSTPLISAFLSPRLRPVYNLDILKPRDEEGEGGEAGATPSGKSDDEMYDKAVAIVTQSRNASISWVQRQLRIGYNRAARLVEEMEKQGVISPPDHTNKREVLVGGIMM